MDLEFKKQSKIKIRTQQKKKKKKEGFDHLVELAVWSHRNVA